MKRMSAPPSSMRVAIVWRMRRQAVCSPISSAFTQSRTSPLRRFGPAGSPCAVRKRVPSSGSATSRGRAWSRSLSSHAAATACSPTGITPSFFPYPLPLPLPTPSPSPSRTVTAQAVRSLPKATRRSPYLNKARLLALENSYLSSSAILNCWRPARSVETRATMNDNCDKFCDRQTRTRTFASEPIRCSTCRPWPFALKNEFLVLESCIWSYGQSMKERRSMVPFL